MTDAAWQQILRLFDENEERLRRLLPAKPIPTAKLWRDSAHGTLGHLTACQAAWLPLLKMIEVGEARGRVAVRPDPLYTQLEFKNAEWTELQKRFKKERAEWRKILKKVDLSSELKTPTRVFTAKTLTKRLVDHEKRHLGDLKEE